MASQVCPAVPFQVSLHASPSRGNPKNSGSASSAFRQLPRWSEAGDVDKRRGLDLVRDRCETVELS